MCHSPAARTDHLARKQASDQLSQPRGLLTHNPTGMPARHPAHLRGGTQARPPTCSRTRVRTSRPTEILTLERTGDPAWEPVRHRMREPVHILTG
ncbi:hypothetical protein GCM10010310_56460 [Streptomyces violaceolatus]|uniref:Uncharacterized protein n=1 Tax=Streptomyces violaceolatus TaxID=67378 RepID=A0ABN3T6L5_9ACTN